jgi:hypothetical protein
MQVFPWKTFGPVDVGNLATPTVTIELPGPSGPVAVEGLLDTGADVTQLHVGLIDVLGISMNQCAPVKAHGGWRPTTVVQARLDDHVFDLPVTFVDRQIGDEVINLFGRTGLLDIYRIVHDPVQRRTEFEWIENLPPSAAAVAYEKDVVAWLGLNPVGFVDGVEYQ